MFVFPHALYEVEGYALDDCLAVGDLKWISQTLFEIQEVDTITIETSF